MYHFLTEATKRLIIDELRRFWQYHPKYKDIVEHIQGKYSFRERPQYGIVLKTSSATPLRLSADNFLGTISSYVYLTGVQEHPGLSIEWVREDARAIQDNQGAFPSPPGIYYIEVRESETRRPPYSKEPSYEFYVDPLLDVVDESLQKVSSFVWQTQHPFVRGTLRLYEMPGSIAYVEGVNYTADPTTGNITLTNPLLSRQWLSADYRYAADSTGPWGITENFDNNQAIPGVVLAFGRRIQAGDQLAVVVHGVRQPTAFEYGGKWDVSIELEVVARDVESQQEITDMTMGYLHGILRTRLSTIGVEIMDVSMGGESEDSYDENADDYYYTASISMSMQTDWAIHVPIERVIRKVSPQTSEQYAISAALTDNELGQLDLNTLQNLKIYESLGLQFIQDPFFRVGNTYEKVM